MALRISKPINQTQVKFNNLCALGGGRGGGPARAPVQKLLREDGQTLNEIAEAEISAHLSACGEANPWHVCFAVGVSWGHLADLDVEFTKVAVGLLSNWNDAALTEARSYALERGPQPIEDSLRSGHMLFSKVPLPHEIPDSLEKMRDVQQRWLGKILGPDRPRYIGSWNAAAMFMLALFSKPKLADTMTEPIVWLPPGGPIFHALSLLHRANILDRKPAGGDLDDAKFEPGVLFENNGLFKDLHRGLSDWDLLDVHSGLYMLGTRAVESASWFGMAGSR